MHSIILSTMTDEIKKILKSHGEILRSHGEMLESQREILNSNGEMLRSHGEILNSHGEMLKSHGEMLKTHGGMLKSHGEQLDLIATKVVEHDEQFEWVKEHMATRDDISRVTNTLDKLVKLAETKDQELILLSRGLRDVEDKVKEHDIDIRKMKPALGLS